MTFPAIDIIIIILYLLLIALVGARAGGAQLTNRDYFLGGKNVPWWAVSFSIVAAETSSLTFISIPGLAYLTNLNFLQLTIGYLLARIIIAFLFLPAYRSGDLETAYAFLENRFGGTTRRYASGIFVFTRLAADSVRLFSTAIPLALIFRTMGVFDSWPMSGVYFFAILLIATVSLFYTYSGGVKGVIWADVIQMFIYIGGAILAMSLLLQHNLPEEYALLGREKWQVFNLNLGTSLADFFTKPYTLIGSLVGGTFLSMASHGTDQLIVQRLLTIADLKGSQKAIIVSGLVVMLQFTLFLFIGILLYVFYQGQAIGGSSVPFSRPDEIFPYFIIREMPAGARGLIIAGLFAAAMSTLAGSMSSLSSSIVFDFYIPLSGKKTGELKISRLVTVVTAIILSAGAMVFVSMNKSVVEIALGIASITYGGLLGLFLLGRWSRRLKAGGAIFSFSTGILVMLFVSLWPLISGRPSIMHWTWFVALGTSVTLSTGFVLDKFLNYKE